MILVMMAGALAAISDHDYRRLEASAKVGGAEKEKEPRSLMVELSSHHGLFTFGLVLQERN